MTNALITVGLLLFAVAAVAWMAHRIRLAQRHYEVLTAPTRSLVLDDHAPGINRGWQDQCELIYSLPTARTTTRDHREEEEA